LCAINPYYVVEGLYERSVMASYREKHIGELPPHVYAIANECYYSMWKKGESQCVLIRYIIKALFSNFHRYHLFLVLLVYKTMLIAIMLPRQDFLLIC